MKKIILVILVVLILSLLILSGCLEGTVNGVVYESQPTRVSYTISYGYNVDCLGDGENTIIYNCDIPEVLSGTASNIVVLDDDYSEVTVATFNEQISWDFTKETCEDYTLGISADVIADTNLVSDLSGEGALSIQDIIVDYFTLIGQYGGSQTNDSIKYIDPFAVDIRNIAVDVQNKANSDNSFIVAREIFKWLKLNTYYSLSEGAPKPAISTFENKTGDCDDLTFLYISLCRAINIPARFIRGFLVEEDSVVAHAWAEVYVGNNIGNGGWIAVECAGGSDEIEDEVNTNFAIESADHLRVFVDDGSDESLASTLKGISYSGENLATPEPFVEVTNYQVLESKELLVENNNRNYQ